MVVLWLGSLSFTPGPVGSEVIKRQEKHRKQKTATYTATEKVLLLLLMLLLSLFAATHVVLDL